MNAPVSIHDITAAEVRLAGVARQTPILTSPALDEIAGRRVHVKAECLQHTGSFKLRGAWSAVSALSDEERERGVLGYSSGNHAQGLAHAAARHGIPSVIVMPEDAPASKIDNTRAFGAEVVLYDRAGGVDRAKVGSEIQRERGMTLIPPYDYPQVIAGQGTCGLEIARQYTGGPADVLVCCGGGGLSSGIALALSARAPNLRLRTCEPAGFDDVARSLRAGERLRNEHLSGSVCDAILTPTPGALTFPILDALAGPGLVVTDDECLRAMALAFKHLKIVVEPGGAAALAAALFRADDISGEDVVVVATGGNVEPDLFSQAISHHL